MDLSWQILMYAIMLAFIAATVRVLIDVVRCAVKSIAEKKYVVAVFGLLPILCMIIVAVSYFVNMGILRQILLMGSIPFLHAFFLSLAAQRTLKYIDKSIFLDVVSGLTYVSYLISYIFLPDVKQGVNSVCFGLIKNEAFVDKAIWICIISLATNLVFLLMQFVAVSFLKNSVDDDDYEDEENEEESYEEESEKETVEV